MIKRFLIIFLPLSALLAAIFSYTYYDEKKHSLELLKTEERIIFHKIQEEVVSVHFRDIVSDLLFLAQEHELQHFLEAEKGYTQNDLKKDYLSYILQEGVYDQISFVNGEGIEELRVNYNNGAPSLVPAEELQNRNEQYYFQEAFKLNKGEVFISPFELSIEGGKIEVPYKPIIRFATPVFDNSGRKRGVILLSFLGQIILDDLRSLSERTARKTSLLDHRGCWLIGEDAESEWGFMFEERKEKTYAREFPLVWKQINEKKDGQFLSKKGLFTFTTIFPLKEVESLHIGRGAPLKVTSLNNEEFFWTAVFHIPTTIIAQSNAEHFNKYLSLFLVLALVTAIGCWNFCWLYYRRLETEDALQKTELNLAKAQEIAHVGSCEWEINKNEISCSEETYRIFGISKKNATPTLQCIKEQIIGEERKEFEERLEKAVQKTGHYEMECTILRSDGAQRVVLLRGEVVKDRSGKPVRVIGSVQDVTEQKRFEEALRKAHNQLEERVKLRTTELNQLNKRLERDIEMRERAEEALMLERQRLYSLLNELPGFVYLQAPDYSIRYANDAFIKLFGDYRDKKCFEAISKKNESCSQCLTFKVFESNQPQEWEWSNDDNRIFQIYDYPFTDIDGSNLVLELGIDITERKRAEEKLEELNKDLEKTVAQEIAKRRQQEQFMIQQSKMAAMGEMVSSIAHQWRQPLNGLGLLIQDVNDAYEYGELNKQYISEMVLKSMKLIQYMSSTIDDFRNFFKPSKEKCSFYIDTAIRDVISLLSSQLTHHEIRVKMFCNGEELNLQKLNDSNGCCNHEESEVFGYQNEFKQVIINIINNARQVIDDKLQQEKESDWKQGDIYIRRSVTRENVIVEIEDNGGGIQEEVIDRVFEPYYTTKEEGKGTGIGLYMAKVIIEQNMGGTLTASNGEKGAIFTITLKRNTPSQAS